MPGSRKSKQTSQKAKPKAKPPAKKDVSPKYHERLKRTHSSTSVEPEASVKRRWTRSYHPNHDPFKRLNQDTINIILSLMPPKELINMERVSRGWKTAIRGWIESIGLRAHFPSSWVPAHLADVTEASAYDAFKRNGM
ncbi:hypothetical protein BJX70DRAFT_364607 [Aspergillus crustosus]